MSIENEIKEIKAILDAKAIQMVNEHAKKKHSMLFEKQFKKFAEARQYNYPEPVIQERLQFLVEIIEDDYYTPLKK